jgi:hypothetical protein
VRDNFLNALSQAILQTVAYSDIFDYPLTAPEIHRYLTGVRTSLEEVQEVLENDDFLTQIDPYFNLPGREEIVDIRKQREARSQKLMPIALKYGRILGSLPFVRMVALTGSLAVLNVSKNLDFDYMLVAAKGRVWTARAFALLLNRFARLFGHTLCPNLILSESALEWQLHDLYSARELHQMIPVTGLDVYQRLMEVNKWAEEFLPNAYPSRLHCIKRNEVQVQVSPAEQSPPSSHWRLLRRSLRSLLAMTELVLRGKLGDRFEAWEMTRKIARFSKQPGFGEETIFTAEVCQGNFHHHRKWTHEIYQKRLHVIARRAKPDEAIPTTVSEIASPLATARARNDGMRP